LAVWDQKITSWPLWVSSRRLSDPVALRDKAVKGEEQTRETD
jgi:hypothetical protein